MPAIDSALDAVVGPVAEILGEATTASVLAGAAEVAGGESAAPLTTSSVAGIFNPYVEPVKSTGTIAARAASAGPAAGNVFFPVIDEATAAIADAAVLSPDDYYALAAGHRAGAFTISAALVDGTKSKIRDLLVENLAAGASVKEFVAAVSEGFDTGLPLSRAHVEQVFRNNVHGGFSDGQDAALAASASAGDGFPYRAYNATTDQRVREEHIALETLGLDGTNIYRADDPVWKIFRPPWSWNSVVPSTVVQGAILFALKADYAGDVFELVTKGGRRCTVTKNHPVLTPAGFVFAGDLRVGENLLGYNDPIGFGVSPLQDVDQSPSRIDDLFCAFERFSGSVAVKTAPLDFHGDAGYGDGNVDVVCADRELLNALKSDLLKCSEHLALSGADLNEALMTANRAAVEVFRRKQFSAVGIPHRGQVAGQSVSDDFIFCRVGPASRLNISRYQTRTDQATADAELFSKLQFRYPAEVIGDELVEINVFHYSGPVYDVQTKTGYMVANGIVESNCRCDWSPVSVRQAARRGVTEAAEWLARAEAMAAERGGTAGRYLDETAPGVPAWVPMPKFADDPEVLDPRWRRS